MSSSVAWPFVHLWRNESYPRCLSDLSISLYMSPLFLICHGLIDDLSWPERMFWMVLTTDLLSRARKTGKGVLMAMSAPRDSALVVDGRGPRFVLQTLVCVSLVVSMSRASLPSRLERFSCG